MSARAQTEDAAHLMMFCVGSSEFSFHSVLCFKLEMQIGAFWALNVLYGDGVSAGLVLNINAVLSILSWAVFKIQQMHESNCFPLAKKRSGHASPNRAWIMVIHLINVVPKSALQREAAIKQRNKKMTAFHSDRLANCRIKKLHEKVKKKRSFSGGIIRRNSFFHDTISSVALWYFGRFVYKISIHAAWGGVSQGNMQNNTSLLILDLEGRRWMCADCVTALVISFN